MKKLLIFGSMALLACSESSRSFLTQDGGGSNPAPTYDLSGGTFNPLAPMLTSVAPNRLSTAGGSQLVLTGGPFFANSNFFINNQLVSATMVTSTSATLLVPPRLAVGPATITVRNPDGTSVTNSNAKNSATAFALSISQLSFSQVSYATQGNQPRGVAFGDLNGDGFLDAVVSHVSQGVYTTFLGNGTGAFTPLVIPAVAGPTFAVIGNQAVNQTAQLVDFNNDNKLDLLLATQSANVHYYLGNGTGRLDQIASNNYGTSAAVPSAIAVDFNGDNLPDIVSANTGASNIGLFLNTNNNPNMFPAAQFQVLNPGGQPTRVMTADLDGDKKPDLVAVMQNNGGNTLAVYFGNGSATAPSFVAATPLNYGLNATNQAPQWGDLGDVNGDGKIDCVIVDTNTASLRVFLGSGTQTNTFNAASNPIQVGLDPRQLVLGDFNGDGKLDVVVTNHNADNVSLLLGDGAGAFPMRQDYTSLKNPWAVVTADFNADGKLDFAVVNEINTSGSTNPGYLTIYLNTSS